VAEGLETVILDEEQRIKELEHARQMVREWQATAEVLEDPETVHQLNEAQREMEQSGFGQFPVVPSPASDEARKRHEEVMAVAKDAFDNATRVLALAEMAAKEAPAADQAAALMAIHDRWIRISQIQ
jgi:hypothetical protein